MLNNCMHKEIIVFLEQNIIGMYDNDTLKLIVNYINKRIKDIENIIKEEEEENERN